jgi:hypothetical protein
LKYGALVAIAAAVGACLYYYNHVNEEIRQRVLSKLSAHYPGLKVEVRSALLVDGEGIEIRGVSISDPRLAEAHAELAYFDEIALTCRTELQEFVDGDPEITHLRIRRPRIRATHLGDGRWTVASLLPCPKFGKHRLETTVENGVVELIDATRQEPTTFTLRDLHLKLHPIIAEHDDGDEPARFEGSCAGDFFQRIQLSGRIERAGQGFQVDQGVIDRLEISPEFQQALPRELAVSFAPLSSLRATCSINQFAILYRPNQAAPWQFDMQGKLSRGRYDDPRLPEPLTELAATFRADNRGIVVDELTGRLGHSSIRVFGQLHGLTAAAPLTFDVRAEHLLIGRHWERVLTPQLHTLWQKFQPAGEIDAHAVVSYDGQQWNPEVDVFCHNVSFTYHKFLYRVDRGRGTIALRNNHLDLNLIAQAGSKPIEIKGKVDDPGPNFTGEVTLVGADLPIEPKMLDALAPNPQKHVKSLNPSGTFDFFMRIGRNHPQQPRTDLDLTLDLKGCSIRYDRFPYPIGNISGRVQMKDGRWWSNNLAGINDIGRISCRATLVPPNEGSKLSLWFAGRDIAIEEELRDALPPKVQKVWNDLRPRGSVNLDVVVRHMAGEQKPNIQVTKLEPIGNTVSLEPVYFPYRMENLHGTFSYRQGDVHFADVRANHGPSRLTANGWCEFDDAGAWRLHFKRLTANSLRAETDLIAALPGRLKQVVSQLRPTGPIALDGGLEFASNGTPGAPLRSRWNLNLGLQQSTINAGVLLENVSGGLRLEGEHDGRLRSGGELDIESLTFKGFQFTNVRSPLWIDDRQLILGSHAEQAQPSRPPRRMHGELYDGVVQADLWVGLQEPPQYVFQATIDGSDLARFASEQLAGNQRLKGKVTAGVALEGTGAGLYMMKGNGELRLRDADIYQLPLMVQLLKILSIRLPDETGFDKSAIKFRIDGERIALEEIEFSGDAISLLGAGQMNLNSEIRATMSAIVGRSEWQLPMFKTMMGQASQQLMQIHVDGTLANPQIRREAFPGINQAFGQLQAEMQPRARTQLMPQATRINGGRR